MEIFSVCPIQLASVKINNRVLCRNNPLLPPQKTMKIGEGGRKSA